MKSRFTIWRYVLRICLVLVVVFSSTQAQWKQCNGPLGGTIYAMTQSGSVLLAAIESHGILRSTDKGAHWIQTTVGEGITANRLTAVGALTVYACTDSGLYRSKDNGASWTRLLSTLPGEVIRSFTVKGTILFAGSAGVGVYRSTDDGATWKETNLGLHSKSITSLTVIDTMIYAGTYGNGAYRSPDNGESWWPLYVNVSNSNAIGFERFLLAAQGNVLYCGMSDGMQRSKDFGITWESCDTGREVTQVNTVEVIDSTIYTIAGKYIYYSTNHGDSWQQISTHTIPANFSSIAILGSQWFIGSYGEGIYTSTTRGAQWQAVNTGVSYQNVTKLASHGKDIYAGTFNSGVYKSEDHGVSWQHIGLYSQGVEALHCVGDSIVLASTEQAIYRSTDGGRTWADTIKTRFFVRQFVSMGDVLFAGVIRLYPVVGSFRPMYKSLDKGKTWTELSFELEQRILYTFTRVNSTLFAVGKGLFRSTDLGDTWQETDTMFHNTYIQDLCQLGSSIIIFTEFGEVFRSENMGTSWIKIDSGIIKDYAYSIYANGTTSYLGTFTKGIFKSDNSGATWTDANAGLTNTTGNTFCFAGTTLYLGTNTGVWKLENALDVKEEIPPSVDAQSLICYPNPATSAITVDCSSLPSYSSATPVRYSITTISGRSLIGGESQDAQWSISTTDLSSGVYYVIARQGLSQWVAVFSVLK
ncbi:MAG: hypothetical protein U0264_00360 [Candidatus Kapaibacterium sp.]